MLLSPHLSRSSHILQHAPNSHRYLAPKVLEFYDQDWQEIGTQYTLIRLLSETTDITLDHLYDFSSASVAQMMSWAT